MVREILKTYSEAFNKCTLGQKKDGKVEKKGEMGVKWSIVVILEQCLLSL